MGSNLDNLDPALLWKYFASLSAIPRPSKNEERVAAWIRSVCNEHDLAVQTDKVGNLVVTVPASEGLERAQTVILQSHIDMVCEKDLEVSHDFMEDPIQTYVDGDWVRARGTTLGADNGIGVAAALAVATDPTLKHGPLELLFTVDEETGMTGAGGLDTSLLKGKLLINMDTEEDGVLCVGCAGGADNLLTLECARVAPQPVGRVYSLEVAGLRGGHSGVDIHENRGNALKILTRTLISAIESGLYLELVDLIGGKMRNAIPRRAVARLFLDANDEKKFRSLIDTQLASFRTELKGIDEGLTIQFEPCQHEGQVLSREDRNRFLRLLMVVPDGVLAMSPAIPGLVETSNCMSVVELVEEKILIVASSRSSLSPALDSLLGSISAAAALAGAEVETGDRYPGWNPDINSSLLETMRGVFSEVLNQEPTVNAVHAGLECGLLSQKMPKLDMVSFGPQIEGAHSPDEKANIPSVGRFWIILKRALEVLAT
jgi:dipeptidase D